MKLAKLSLAAIVAAGAMTTFASAAPLEEAIKGVDLKGTMRYRVDINDNGATPNTGAENHRFSGAFTFTVPVAENVKSILTLTYDKADNAKTSAATADRDFGVSQAYFSYSTKDIVLNVGKMIVDTPWTYNSLFDGNLGNGLVGMYKGVEGWTFAAATFFNIGAVDTTTPTNIMSALGEDNNLYAAAAIGSVGPVNAQIWLAKMTNTFDYSAFLELSAKYEGFGLKGQVNQMKLDDKKQLALAQADDKGTFWAVEGTFGYEGLGLKAAYLRNDKDQKYYTIAADNKMIRAGHQMYGAFANLADAKTYYVTADYKFGQYSVGAGHVNTKTGSDKYGTENYVQASYAYSKNFTLFSYYSDLDRKKSGNGENKRLRLQAQYNF